MTYKQLATLLILIEQSEEWELELSGPNRFPTAMHKIYPFWGLAIGCACPHPIFEAEGLYNVLPHWWGLC